MSNNLSELTAAELSADAPRAGECPAKCEKPCKSWALCATRQHPDKGNPCTCGMRQTDCICGKPRNVNVR